MVQKLQLVYHKIKNKDILKTKRQENKDRFYSTSNESPNLAS
jgi:hypothetical protein